MTPHPDIVAYRAAGSSTWYCSSKRRSLRHFWDRTVNSSDGKAMGRISDLVIDSKDCRVALVIVDEVPGRAMHGRGSFRRTVDDRQRLCLQFHGDRLASAPVFMYADADNPRYARDVYVYFGLQPYWTIGSRFSRF